MPLTLMFFDIFYLFLLLLVHNVSATGIEFTTPAGGATLPAGPIEVHWQDAGGTPDMADLVTGTLVLVVGGNSASNSQVLQTIGTANATIAGGTVSGNISPDVAQSIQNGFYLMMTSNTTDGNTVINYSNRFTLLDMSGTTDSQILQGAMAAAGSVSNVPSANTIERPSTTTSTTSSTTPTATATNTDSTSTSTSTPTPPPHNDNDPELSSSTLAAIIVGAIMACIGAISLVIWAVFFYKRIRRKRAEQKAQDEVRKSIFGANWDKAELPADDHRSDHVHMGELSPQDQRFEAPAWDKAVEAPGNEPVFELEGDIALWEAGSGRRSKAWDPTAM